MARAKTTRAPRALTDHLTASGLAVGAITALVLVVLAALATSRANGHVLSPAGVIAVVIGVAVALSSLGWANGLYGGAEDVLEDRVVFTCEPGCASEPADDPWQPAQLWRAVLIASAAAGLWAGATAGLVAVVLDAERAPFIVVCATLIGTVSLAATVVDIAARHRGVHAARAQSTTPVRPIALRRRAWREIALPIGALQLVINAAATWMLFHDYTGTDGPRALTGSVVTSDFPIIALIAAAYLGVTATRWGRIDATLGRVTLDDPPAQTVGRSTPIGPQGLVYITVAAIVLGNVIGYVLPSRPSLLAAAVARGLFAAAATTLAVGAGYVRGAVNAGLGPDLAVFPLKPTQNCVVVSGKKVVGRERCSSSSRRRRCSPARRRRRAPTTTPSTTGRTA